MRLLQEDKGAVAGFDEADARDGGVFAAAREDKGGVFEDEGLCFSGRGVRVFRRKKLVVGGFENAFFCRPDFQEFERGLVCAQNFVFGESIFFDAQERGNVEIRASRRSFRINSARAVGNGDGNDFVRMRKGEEKPVTAPFSVFVFFKIQAFGRKPEDAESRIFKELPIGIAGVFQLFVAAGGKLRTAFFGKNIAETAAVCDFRNEDF